MNKTFVKQRVKMNPMRRSLNSATKRVEDGSEAETKTLIW